MPMEQEDLQALEWATSNPDDERSGPVLQKLGLDAEDGQAYRWASDNRNDPRAKPIGEKVLDKAKTFRHEVDAQQYAIGGQVPILGPLAAKAGHAVRAAFSDGDFSENYDLYNRAHQQKEREWADENPRADMAAQLAAGGMVPGVNIAAKGKAAIPAVIGSMGANAGVAAGDAALRGYDPTTAAGFSAAIEGTARGLGGIGNWMQRKGASTFLRVPEEIQDYYKGNREGVTREMDDLGVFPAKVDRMRTELDDEVKAAVDGQKFARQQYATAKAKMQDLARAKDMPEEATDRLMDVRQRLRQQRGEESGKAFNVLEAKGRPIDTGSLIDEIDDQISKLHIDPDGPLDADDAYQKLLKIRNRLKGIRIDPERLKLGISTEFQGLDVNAKLSETGQLQINVIDPSAPRNKKIIAYTDLVDDVPEADGMLYPMLTNVEEAYQRKGIATYMYNLAEDLTGKKVSPAAPNAQSADAAKFWDNRNQNQREVGSLASPEQIKRSLMQFDQGVAGPLYDKLRRGESLTPSERIAVGMRGALDEPLKQIPEYAEQMKKVAPIAELSGQLDKMGDRRRTMLKLREVFSPKNKAELEAIMRADPEIVDLLKRDQYDLAQSLRDSAQARNKYMFNSPENRDLQKANAHYAEMRQKRSDVGSGKVESLVPGRLPMDGSTENKLRALAGDDSLVRQGRDYAAAKNLASTRFQGSRASQAWGPGAGGTIAGIVSWLSGNDILSPATAVMGGIGVMGGAAADIYGGRMYKFLSDMRASSVGNLADGLIQAAMRGAPQAIPRILEREAERDPKFAEWLEQYRMKLEAETAAPQP